MSLLLFLARRCELGYPRKDVLRGGLDNVRSEPAAISVKMSTFFSGFSVCVLVLKGTCKSPNHIRMDPMGVIFVCIYHLPTL